MITIRRLDWDFSKIPLTVKVKSFIKLQKILFLMIFAQKREHLFYWAVISDQGEVNFAKVNKGRKKDLRLQAYLDL